MHPEVKTKLREGCCPASVAGGQDESPGLRFLPGETSPGELHQAPGAIGASLRIAGSRRGGKSRRRRTPPRQRRAAHVEGENRGHNETGAMAIPGDPRHQEKPRCRRARRRQRQRWREIESASSKPGRRRPSPGRDGLGLLAKRRSPRPPSAALRAHGPGRRLPKPRRARDRPRPRGTRGGPERIASALLV
jgi:hypothetical protein